MAIALPTCELAEEKLEGARWAPGSPVVDRNVQQGEGGKACIA